MINSSASGLPVNRSIAIHHVDELRVAAAVAHDQAPLSQLTVAAHDRIGAGRAQDGRAQRTELRRSAPFDLALQHRHTRFERVEFIARAADVLKPTIQFFEEPQHA